LVAEGVVHDGEPPIERWRVAERDEQLVPTRGCRDAGGPDGTGAESRGGGQGAIQPAPERVRTGAGVAGCWRSRFLSDFRVIWRVSSSEACQPTSKIASTMRPPDGHAHACDKRSLRTRAFGFPPGVAAPGGAFNLRRK